MKIILLGNMGVGKTTLAKKLLKVCPVFSYWAIDDCRRKYSDGTMAGEKRAQELFLQGIIPHQLQAIEASGLGALGKDLAMRVLSTGEAVHVFILLTPLAESLKRLQARQWDIPYPAPPAMALESLQKAHESIQHGDIQKQWHGFEQVVVYAIDTTIDHYDQIAINSINKLL